MKTYKDINLYVIIIFFTSLSCQTVFSQGWIFQEQNTDFNGTIYKADVSINSNTRLIVQTSGQKGENLKVIINKKNFKNVPFDDETYIHILFSFDKKRIYQSRGLIDNQTGNIYINQFALNGWVSAFHNISFINDLKNSNRLVIKLDKLIGFGSSTSSTLFPSKQREAFFTEVVKSNQRNHIPQELPVSLLHSKKSIENVIEISDYRIANSKRKFSSDSLMIFTLFQSALNDANKIIPDEVQTINEYVKNVILRFEVSGIELNNITRVELNSSSYHPTLFVLYFRDDEYEEELYTYIRKYQGINEYFPFR